jgi:hypothetical protein
MCYQPVHHGQPASPLQEDDGWRIVANMKIIIE